MTDVGASGHWDGSDLVFECIKNEMEELFGERGR